MRVGAGLLNGATPSFLTVMSHTLEPAPAVTPPNAAEVGETLNGPMVVPLRERVAGASAVDVAVNAPLLAVRGSCEKNRT